MDTLVYAVVLIDKNPETGMCDMSTLYTSLSKEDAVKMYNDTKNDYKDNTDVEILLVESLLGVKLIECEFFTRFITK